MAVSPQGERTRLGYAVKTGAGMMRMLRATDAGRWLCEKAGVTTVAFRPGKLWADALDWQVGFSGRTERECVAEDTITEAMARYGAARDAAEARR